MLLADVSRILLMRFFLILLRLLGDIRESYLNPAKGLIMSYITYEVTVCDDSCTEWRLDGILHREDGPAVEWNNGTQEWYLNGKLHRDGEPAMKAADGSKFWWINGKRHRTDGPAVEYSNGKRYWYLEGKEYTEAEYHAKLRPDPCEGRTVTIDGTEYTLNRAQE